MKEKRDFEEYWKLLTNQLSTKQTIRNWTRDHKYIGENFTAIYISAPHRKEGGYIEMDPPSAVKTQKVKKHSFQKVHPLWDQYLQEKKSREDIRDITWHSKYIISVMHQFENLMYK